MTISPSSTGETYDVRDLRAVVVGAARSGLAAAELLARRGARVVLTDRRERVEGLAALRALGVSLELGGHRPATLTEAELVVLSPGVSPRIPVVAAAQAAGVPVISEIELAARWLRGPIVAVTGTKGKSTTTQLTGRVLEADGRRALVGGNVGTALSSQVEASAPDVIHVVETSSFQLELTDTFRPWISVFLNMSPDHLDRHGSLEAYGEAKARIFANQGDDDAMVINADDPYVLELARRGRARRVPFALREPIRDGVVVDGDRIVQRTGDRVRPLLPLSAVRVQGRHQLSDVLAAAAVSSVVGVAPDRLERGVASFDGLEHALQTVATVAGVRFVDDSKATNVAAVLGGLESFEPGLVVIMGGQFKGGDLGLLAPALRARAEAVVAIGEARPRIRDAFDGVVPVREAASMVEAVATASELAPPGGVVLLAPACASFDMFTDYADRGRQFAAAVRSLEDASSRT